MAASVTDKFTSATNGSRPAPTTLTALHAGGGTTLSCAALNGWPTATAVHFIVYNTSTSGAKIAGSQTDWKGVVSGTDLVNCQLKAGTDSGYSIGAVVECSPTAYWAKDLADGLQVAHNQDGTIKASSVIPTPKITTSINDSNGNEVIKTPASTGAVNELTATNAATGAAPKLSASGDDTNISLDLVGKGTGSVRINGTDILQGQDYFVSGCAWTADAPGSTRVASMSSGVVCIGGNFLTVAAVTSRTFTASKDVYVDFKDNGDGTAVPVYYDNTTNAASPSFATTTGTVRNAIIVVGASSIASDASINQGLPASTVPTTCNVGGAGIDSLGNKIYRRDPWAPLIFSQNVNLSSSGDVSSLTLPLLVNSRIMVTGHLSTECVNTPSCAMYSRLYVDGSNVDEKRIDTDATAKVWASFPHSYQGYLAAGSKIVKLNLTLSGGGSYQYTATAMVITVWPA